MKRWLTFIALLLTACATDARQHARNFVDWDAASDAANVAADHCHGQSWLIEGRKGYAPSDYRCKAAGTDQDADRGSRSFQSPSVADISLIENRIAQAEQEAMLCGDVGPACPVSPPLVVATVSCPPASRTMDEVRCSYDASGLGYVSHCAALFIHEDGAWRIPYRKDGGFENGHPAFDRSCTVESTSAIK